MTTEEIKEHFKDAKTVKCLKDGKYYAYLNAYINVYGDNFYIFDGEDVIILWTKEDGFAEIVEEPLVETQIHAEIVVESYGDFSLDFTLPHKGEYEISNRGNYNFKLTLEEDNAVEVISDFLRSFTIHSSKDWHKKDLKEGIEKYLKQLSKGLCSSEDFLGGGNWTFRVDVTKLSKTYL